MQNWKKYESFIWNTCLEYVTKTSWNDYVTVFQKLNSQKKLRFTAKYSTPNPYLSVQLLTGHPCGYKTFYPDFTYVLRGYCIPIFKLAYFMRYRYLTINDNDMLSYSLTTMMCFLTKEWYGFSAYTVNLFIKAYHRITYKEDLKIP